jgi:hypothetical protein
MNNNDIFLRSPLSYDIPNLGVAKLSYPSTEQEWAVLRFELQNYVCEGEYRAGLERILDTFMTNLAKPQQPAVWVSGFYGSGKSHFVRVLECLWNDTRLPDGASARGIVPLPGDVREKIVELDRLGRQEGGLWAAAGKLGASGGSIRLALLSVVLKAANLPEDYSKARFVLYFEERGMRGALEDSLARRQRSLNDAINYMTIDDDLAEAVLEVQPTFASDVVAVKSKIETEFSQPHDISTDQLLTTIKQVLALKSSKPDKSPLLLLVFDELQQYLGGDIEKADELLTVVEDVSSRLQSRVLFVATGQSEMAATAELQKLQDRFRVRVTLGVSDVETVVRRVVLAKRPEAVAEVTSTLTKVRGEIDQQLAGTAIAPVGADAPDLVTDYPLLPSRRRFWERVLRGFDNMGRAGQLRTQLRVVHETVKAVADKPVGWVVGGDALFDQLKPDMLQTGALPREIASTIDELRQQPDGELSSRLCQLIFLIGKMPTQGLFAAGLKATPNMLADLLVVDLVAGGTALRQRIPQLLERLVKRGTLQLIGDEEYGLQTKVGAEWQQDYEAKLISCKADLLRLRDARQAEFREAVDEAKKLVKVVQGASKEPRRVAVVFGEQPPPAGGTDINIWVRDEWSEPEKRVKDDARSAGVDSATIFVFLPKRRADVLMDAIASLQARDETLARPAPTTDAGRDAKASMEALRKRDRETIDELVSDILAEGAVIQGGGVDVGGDSFAAKLSTAANASASRLFPKFGVADNAKWGDVLPYIKAGSGDPLQKVGHSGPVEDHQVCKEILGYLANRSEKGASIRAHFAAAPFGWPRDAVDGALMALVASGLLVARRNGQAAEAKTFDTNTIGGAEFQQETEVVPTATRLALRALVKGLIGLNVKPGEEGEGVRTLLDTVKDLAQTAGGEPPLPVRPSAVDVDDLRGLSGNRQLNRTFDARETIRHLHGEWSGLTKLAKERLPVWDRTEVLAKHARSLDVDDDIGPSLIAIREHRQLLDNPDPIVPIHAKLTTALRSAISAAHRKLENAREAGVQGLEAMPEWSLLASDQRVQVLTRHQLTPITPPKVANDEELLTALETTSLAEWDDKLAAIGGRIDAARLDVVKLVEPESILVELPRRTIKNDGDLNQYVEDVRRLIADELGGGHSVLIR